MNMLKIHWSQQLWKAVASRERHHKVRKERRASTCGAPADGSRAAVHPRSPQHLGQRFRGIHMLLYKAIISHFGHGWASQCGRLLPALSANRLLPAILVLAGVKPGWIFVEDSAAVPSMQHRTGAVLYNLAVYLGFMVLPTAHLLPGVKVEALLCMLFSDVLGKKEFPWQGKREAYGFLKLRFPCSKTTDFLRCHKIIPNKWTQSRLTFCPASLYWELAKPCNENEFTPDLVLVFCFCDVWVDPDFNQGIIYSQVFAAEIL